MDPLQNLVASLQRCSAPEPVVRRLLALTQTKQSIRSGHSAAQPPPALSQKQRHAILALATFAGSPAATSTPFVFDSLLEWIHGIPGLSLDRHTEAYVHDLLVAAVHAAATHQRQSSQIFEAVFGLLDANVFAEYQDVILSSVSSSAGVDEASCRVTASIAFGVVAAIADSAGFLSTSSSSCRVRAIILFNHLLESSRRPSEAVMTAALATTWRASLLRALASLVSSFIGPLPPPSPSQQQPNPHSSLSQAFSVAHDEASSRFVSVRTCALQVLVHCAAVLNEPVLLSDVLALITAEIRSFFADGNVDVAYLTALTHAAFLAVVDPAAQPFLSPPPPPAGHPDEHDKHAVVEQSQNQRFVRDRDGLSRLVSTFKACLVGTDTFGVVDSHEDSADRLLGTDSQTAVKDALVNALCDVLGLSDVTVRGTVLIGEPIQWRVSYAATVRKTAPETETRQQSPVVTRFQRPGPQAHPCSFEFQRCDVQRRSRHRGH
jgi:hypothetical protein